MPELREVSREWRRRGSSLPRLRQRRRARRELDGRRGQCAHAHVTPRDAFPDQGGQAEHDRGHDLDRLQDDPVAQRGRGRNAVPARQHGQHRQLEDTHVRRSGREHRGDVDREEHGRGGAQSTVASQVHREHQGEGAEQLQPPGGELGRRGPHGAAGAAEDHQPLAESQERCGRLADQPSEHAPRPDAAVARGEQRGHDQHSRGQPHRNQAEEHDRLLTAVQHVARAQHDHAQTAAVQAG